MAYQLKTTGIAANCTMMIAVDPDTGAVKDFASSAVTADMTVDAGVAIGDLTWNGVSRKYFQTSTTAFVAFGATKPLFDLGVSATDRTIVGILEVVAGTAQFIFGPDASNYFAVRSVASGSAAATPMLAMSTLTAGTASVVAGEKRILGGSLVYNTSAQLWSAQDTDSAMTNAGLKTPSGGESWSPSYLNRRNLSATDNPNTGKTFAIMIFDKALSEAEWDSLRSDWFGVMLEAAGGAGAELDGDATASVAAAGSLDSSILLDADATASATASGALAATAPTVAITSFAASGADLVIGYTHTSVGSSPLLTASLERDGTPIADVTTSTLSGTFTITDPGPGVYTLTLLTLADSEGTDTDGPWGSTATILGAAAVLEGDADAAVSASGALTTGIPLAGASIISTAATGDLSTAVQLAAAAIASGQATGELAGAITLQGAAVTATLASGELTAQIRLAGTALAAAIASAGLTTEILLAAAAQAGAQATGALTTGEGLEGAATASAQAAGSLTTLIVLSGAAVSSLLASGALTTAPSGLAGDATAGATAAGALTTQIPLSGGAQVSVIASGDATTSITLAGAAVAVVGATGDLVVALGLSATALASAIAGADLSTAVVLRADAVVGAQAGGVLSGFVYVASERRTYMARRRVRKAIAGIT